MSFLFSKPSPAPAAAAPLPPPPTVQPASVSAPVQLARSVEPTGDAAIADKAAAEKKQRRGGAGRRRGLPTILTGDQAFLGATTGKTLLGV